MHLGHMVKAVRWARPWTYLLVCLVVLLGGCQAKEPQLSEEAQALKKELLREINNLATLVSEPVAKENGEATKKVLQTSYEKMIEGGKFVPTVIVTIDRNGVAQNTFPTRRERHFDFSRYGPVKKVFDKKRKIQAKLYQGETKIFVLIAPLLQKGEVSGAVAMAFSENELEKWKVSENEFLTIAFNP